MEDPNQKVCEIPWNGKKWGKQIFRNKNGVRVIAGITEMFAENF